MKDKLRQLLALILALSICFSLLSANVWATDEPEDVPTENTEVVTEKDKSEEKQEEAPAEAPSEDKQEEAPAETQNENKQEEAPAETQNENKQEETPAETQSENKQEETPAEAQSEKKQEEEAPAQNEAETQPIKKKAPARKLTAAAGGTEVTKANVICQQYSYMDAGSYSGGTMYDTPPADITNIALADAQAFGAAVNCPTTYWVVVYAKDGDNLKWTSNGKTGEQTSTPDRISAWSRLYNGDVFSLRVDPMRNVTFYFSKGLATVGVTGVSLDKTTAQTIDVDGKVSFTATVSPDNATDKTVKWSVGGTDAGAVKLYSNEACTTEVGADATDKLTVYAKGISAGSATVTATSNADSEKSASCDVTVNAAGDTTYTITIPSTLTVANSGWNSIGNITADNAENTFDTSKKLTVTASSANSWNLKSSENNTVSYTMCNGTTSKGEAATSWTFTPAQLNESNAATQGIGIDVSDYSDKPAGTYTDTVTFTASVEDTAPATVPVTAITLNKTATEINVGQTETLSVTAVTPDNATDKTVTWSSDKESVATVDADGKVTAVAAGTANITATANGGSGVTATCAVTVTIPVTSVTINNAPTEALFVNSTGTLTATVLPADATDKTVTWSSSDPDYVSINAETGEYTIMGKKGYGSATITATAGDKTATCTITGKVTYTSLSAGTVLHVGDTFYAGKVYFNTTPSVNFLDSNGVITLVEANGCYKFKRGSNGTMPNVTAYKIKDNTDGVYIVSGAGTRSDKFTLAVHTK